MLDNFYRNAQGAYRTIRNKPNIQIYHSRYTRWDIWHFISLVLNNTAETVVVRKEGKWEGREEGRKKERRKGTLGMITFVKN